MRKLLFGFLVVLFLLTVAIRVYQKLHSQPPASLAQMQASQGVPVETTIVRRETLASKITVNGEVRSDEEASLSSKIGGRLITLTKQIGDSVLQGELLAKVDTSQLEVQRAQALNQVAMAERNLSQARLRLENARREWERRQRLFEEGVVARAQLERYELEYQTAREQEGVCQAALEAARDGLRLIETTIRDASLQAPFAGVIGERRAEVGEVVAAGQPIYTLYNIGSLIIRVQVPEKDVLLLRPGQEAEFFSPNLPEPVTRARVSRIAGAPDSKSKLYAVELKVLSRSAVLKPGLFLQGTITTGRKNGVLTVPVTAILQAGDTYSVYVVKDGKAVRRPVEVGETSGEQVEILTGLSPGEEVITLGKENVSSGTRVLVKSTEKKS